MDLSLDPPATSEPPVHLPHSDPNNSHNHAPYAEMITAAITALKEKNGSSRQAIAKYIEQVYPNLPASHSALLTQQLKRLKNSGELVMVKHSYMLAGSVPVPFSSTTTGNGNGDAFSSGPKKGPGRPHKPKVIEAQPNSGVVGPESVLVSLGLVDGPSSPVSKRGPGRPPKVKDGPEFVGPVGLDIVNEPAPAGLGILDGSAPVGLGDVDGPAPVAKRGPGRPPKAKSGPAGTGLAGPLGLKRGRGRPPRPKSMSILMGPSGPKRRVRRTPGLGGPAVVPRPRGRPRKVGSVKKAGRPGRPRRNAVAGAATGGGDGGALVAVGGGVLPGKRRGRPPRAGGVVKKPRKLTGKPVGRPKKNALITGIQAAATQHLVAYEDLKHKLEHFQSRIKQAVCMVKPHLNNETAVFALGALQELEELATMDLSAPLNVQVQVQVQEPVLQN